MKKKKVLIVGGGAAGFFCAANLDEHKFNVQIIEQNSGVLQKVKISGGGRCNVSHACFDPRELVGFYPRGQKELLSVFHQFQPGDTMEWFENRGVSLKIEADNRIFPVSNSSQAIMDVLMQTVLNKGFDISTNVAVSKINRTEDGYHVQSNKGDFAADYIVFSTGSSPKSLQILRNLGHTLVDAVPSLFTFNCKNETLEDLMGTSFPQAEITIPQLKIHESGPLLITHWGLSGPAILKTSAWRAREFAALKYNFKLTVNFIGLQKEEALAVFTAFRLSNGKKQIGTSKIFDITTRFWHRILHLAKIDTAKNVASLNNKEIENLLGLLCENTMEVKGKSTYKDEFVTAGGVELKEINFKNMSSKVLENFFIAGEVLNIDAVTGGFNFQACWSEGWIIAQHLNQQQ